MLMKTSRKHCAAMAAVFTILTGGAVAQEANSTPGEISSLPGGASSLQETYQDWSLACQSAPQKVCVISQQQVQPNGQRVLAIELRSGGEGSLSGNLVLPFGLMLDAGAVFQIDEAAQQEARPFLTCLPVGCVVPLDLDADAVAALRAGGKLQVRVQTADAAEVVFPISLIGLGDAADRLEALQDAGSN